MSWFLARRLITAVRAVSALALAACSSTHTQATTASTASASTASPAPTPTTSPPPPPLTSTASVTRQHPITGTTVGVLVSTAPGARITVVAHFEAGDRKKTARADSAGSRKFWFSLGSAPPGVRVTVIVRVAAHGQKRSTRVWFSPRQPPPPPAPPTTAPAPPPQPASCHPLSNEGTCYEPGEFCRESDQGVTGVAGDGETIICEDNNGLRWEPA